MTVAGLGSVSLGVAVPVGVCVGVFRLPVRLVSSRRGLTGRPAAVAGWVAGLGGGAAGWGVRRIVLCGAHGSWGAVGAAGVGAPTLVGWRGGVCVRGPARGDVPQADASRCVSWRVSHRRLRTYGCSWGARRLRGWTPRGCSASVSMASHAACGIYPRAGLGGSSPPTPCGAGGPGPRGRALPGPTFAAPRAACGSSAATTVPGRGRGLGRRSGRGWV